MITKKEKDGQLNRINDIVYLF